MMMTRSANEANGAEPCLSAVALAAAKAAFSPVPPVTTCLELPAMASLVVDGCSAQPMGLEYARQYLANRRN